MDPLFQKNLFATGGAVTKTAAEELEFG